MRRRIHEQVRCRGDFGNGIAKVNEGIEKEGAFYLFTLRLIPVFPFWLINLAMGVTKMRLVTFFWVSQIGMLAGTIVYVDAGKEPVKIDSLEGILSTGIDHFFCSPGDLPFIGKEINRAVEIEERTINSLSRFF